MFQTKEKYLQSIKHEANLTLRILNNLTDESLKQEITEHNWNLGKLAWHLVTAINNIGSQTGLSFDAPDDETSTPASAEYIATSYNLAIDALYQAIENQWSDNDFAHSKDFFGRKMTNGELILLLLQHQIHHRGQITVLMRQAGLKVPGIYGPSKEEWAQV